MPVPVCRYFLTTGCSKGDHCRYRHDRSVTGNPNVCRHFLDGLCVYGSRCRYDHPPRSTVHALNRSSSARLPVIEPITIAAIEPLIGPMMALRPPSTEAGPSRLITTETVSNNNSQLKKTPRKKAWDKPLEWKSDAPAFIPRPVSSDCSDCELCPYFEVSGDCIEGDNCQLIHGDQCDMCGQFVLHPYNQAKRTEHTRECLESHERNMKEAFDNQRSSEMSCGICMENIYDQDQRFGILQNCKHCYCLKCIREWRKSTQIVEKKTARSCPECRVISDFIIPSTIWIDDPEEKKQLIDIYRDNMKSKVCKYMSSGNVDECPFGNKCFYRHELPDGRIVEAGSPKARRSRYDLSEGLQRILSSRIQLMLMDSDMDDDYDDDFDVQAFFG